MDKILLELKIKINNNLSSLGEFVFIQNSGNGNRMLNVKI